MARKKKPEEHENHERWLVSYADFITLLFAFFVVMYALSSVNEGKYRVLSDALIAAFRSAPKSFEPIQVGEPMKAPHDIMQDVRPQASAVEAIRVPIRQQAQVKAHTGLPAEGSKNPEMEQISSQLEVALGALIDKNLISIHKTANWLEVEITSSILYDSGTALLTASAIPVLQEIARIIRDYPNALRVEGFTDNQAIDTPMYPSNWELSAGRAASVVHLFSDEGVDPFRMSAIGYAEYRPKADNSTEEGRRANRRVVVVILSESAEDLFDRSKIIKLEDDNKPKIDIDLDAPLEEITVTPDVDIPSEFPTDLSLKNRDIKPKDLDESVNSISEINRLITPFKENADSKKEGQ